MWRSEARRGILGKWAATMLAIPWFSVVSCALAAEATEPPAPPAVFTERASAIYNVEGDAFEFALELESVKIRLLDASCRELDEETRHRARLLAAELLGAEPVWLFPCEPLKAGAEVQARVWTRKGWLSEILIEAGLAKRCPDLPVVTFKPAEVPVGREKTPPSPRSPAFAAIIEQVIGGDMFEVKHEGQTRRLRLYDVTCEEQPEKASEVATRAVGTDPVWIFPSSRRKIGPTEDLPVRIWTREGWLSDVLLKAAAAKRYPDPDKALEKTGEPTEAGEETVSPRPDRSAPEKGSTWREIPVKGTRLSTFVIKSERFRVPSPAWRLSWRLEPVRLGGYPYMSVFYVDPPDPRFPARASSTFVCTVAGTSGTKDIRYKAGEYWLFLIDAKEFNVKVAVKEPL